MGPEASVSRLPCGHSSAGDRAAIAVVGAASLWFYEVERQQSALTVAGCGARPHLCTNRR